jgi:hypothetical protein
MADGHVRKVVEVLDTLIQEIISDGRDCHVVVILEREGQTYMDVRAAPQACMDSQGAIRILDIARDGIAGSIIPERLKN